MNATELQTMLTEALFEERETQRAERMADGRTVSKANPYITDLGKACDLALWRSFRGEDEDPLDAAALMTFAAGSAFEEVVAAKFKTKNISHLREVRVEIPAGSTVVSGRIDYLLDVGGELVELKSIGAQQLDMMLRPSGKARDEHIAQLNGYLHATQIGALTYRTADGEVVHPPQDEGFLVYGNIKPDWKAVRSYETPIKVFPVHYNPERFAKELDRLAMLWESPTPPPRIGAPDRFPCGSRRTSDGTIKSWCSFYSRCWR